MPTADTVRVAALMDLSPFPVMTVCSLCQLLYPTVGVHALGVRRWAFRSMTASCRLPPAFCGPLPDRHIQHRSEHQGEQRREGQPPDDRNGEPLLHLRAGPDAQ